MKQAVYWVAKHIGLFSLCRVLTRKDIRILAYHGIWLGEGHFGNFLYMSPEKFAHRMGMLNQMGVSVLPLNDALLKLEAGSLPDFPVVLTIDDGWYGTYLYMLPELERNHFPATVYVTSYYSEKQLPVLNVVIQYMVTVTQYSRLDMTGFELDDGISTVEYIDLSHRDDAVLFLQELLAKFEGEERKQQFVSDLGDLLQVSFADVIREKLFHLMTRDQIKDMDRRGVDIQLHTHRHRISYADADCLVQELRDNRDWLEPLLGKTLTHFCYPSGIFSESNWPQLASSGIASATTKETGFVNENSHRYSLPRIMDGEDISDLEFEAEMSGFGQIKRRMFGWVLNGLNFSR